MKLLNIYFIYFFLLLIKNLKLKFWRDRKGKIDCMGYRYDNKVIRLVFLILKVGLGKN